jgi:hypothetical protein
MLARVMTHRHLADLKPFDLQQYREKPMHTIVELDGSETVSSVSSERTPDVNDVIVQDTSAQVVGKLGGYPPQPGILSTVSNATNHIVIVEHLQHARDIAGIILQVCIQCDHSWPADFFKSGIECGTLPGIVSEADNTQLRLLSGQIPQYLRRMIATAVIHEEEFI